MLSTRPKIAELVFQLYGRSLHPELFEIYESRTIRRGKYEADIQITSAGHLVSWRYEGITLTEIATAAHHPLPKKRRLMSHRLKGDRADQLECRGGIKYEVAFSLEPANAERFFTYQKELSLQATRQGMLHQFDSSGRWETGAMSYINVESRDKIFRVQAFHTFPDDCAVLRIQSSFQLPK
ncbi:MAG: DUF2617 family protein [Planctomycetes bacterium]|nr:DUF2617 family protein [Planctomycetota bacterium]